MTTRTKIITAAVTITAIVAVVYITSSLRENTPAPISPSDPNLNAARTPPLEPLVDMMAVTYDAKTTIPGTGVTFAYPSRGYYEKGAKIETAQHFGTLFEGIEYYNLISIAPFGQQQATVAVYRLGSAKTLDDVMVVQESEMTGSQRALRTVQTINGTRYSLQPSSDNADSYRAYAIVDDRLLEVTFEHGFNAKLDGTVPDLVMQFLTHLDFACDSDCSVNSAPIINMDKYRYGNTE